jgi:cell division protein FtsB
MQRRLSHTKENLTIVILVFLILMMLFVILAGDQGVSALQSKHGQHELLVHTNNALRLKNFEVYREIERLKNDSALIEFVARSDLGMVRKEEMVFKPQDSDILQSSSVPKPIP